MCFFSFPLENYLCVQDGNNQRNDLSFVNVAKSSSGLGLLIETCTFKNGIQMKWNTVEGVPNNRSQEKLFSNHIEIFQSQKLIAQWLQPLGWKTQSKKQLFIHWVRQNGNGWGFFPIFFLIIVIKNLRPDVCTCGRSLQSI